MAPGEGVDLREWARSQLRLSGLTEREAALVADEALLFIYETSPRLQARLARRRRSLQERALLN